MSGVRIGEVLFFARPQDHVPRHVHGFVGGARGPEVLVDLRADRTVTVSDRDDAVRGATRSEIRKVLRAAAIGFDELVIAWEKMHAD